VCKWNQFIFQQFDNRTRITRKLQNKLEEKEKEITKTGGKGPKNVVETKRQENQDIEK
jgi:hypothetical protein